MNKKDLIPVILLALLIPVWMFIDRSFIAPKLPKKTPPPVVQTTEAVTTVETTTPTANTELVETVESTIETTTLEVPVEEQLATLENEKIRVQFTSLGAGIKSVTLFDFPELNKENSDPVVLDFSAAPALAYEGLAGIRSRDPVNIQTTEDGMSVIFSKAWNSGVVFQRTLTISDNYLLSVNDRFINKSSDPWNVPSFRILTGSMENPVNMKAMKGISILGVDSYTVSDGISYWGKELNSMYKAENKPESIDAIPEGMYEKKVDWVSTKNKFFAQILSPKELIATMAVISSRDMNEKAIMPKSIAAALAYKPTIVSAGDTFELNYTYFIGPKKYSILKEAGNKMEKVMEFETTGAFSFMNWLMEPARRFLLWTLNKFHAVIPSYGISIILLTLLIRILFWPLTHKSTESMKRMQEIQPEIKALQEKYKKDPQRMQQETMKLYKEKKANPMGGCLPMFVQIPVFIALFTVLRNAIELRYAGFLWITDLSQPENLFAGSIPVIGSLNILPLLMSASMIWQQKLSSPGTAATPEQQQQQKMMMFMMPIMMLFFFYSMPSGLVLYWTTSNLLMIAQTGMRNLKKKAKEA
ncbi:MAG: membrane protein insertase YidC [Kiritimatiellaceae bacterium]|nr:membrane protein insertase YidC [Kiritimatiellaceae bacterium]